MSDIITLTASDLRGCDGGFKCGTMGGMTAIFHGVSKNGICLFVYHPFHNLANVEQIQCYPYDYIRAWLGPVGELCRGRDSVRVVSGQNQVMFYASDKLWGEYARLDCPAALASAMGSSVWRRTETGWEVQE